MPCLRSLSVPQELPDSHWRTHFLVSSTHSTRQALGFRQGPSCSVLLGRSLSGERLDRTSCTQSSTLSGPPNVGREPRVPVPSFEPSEGDRCTERVEKHLPVSVGTIEEEDGTSAVLGC
jgi:hypothetical protein